MKKHYVLLEVPGDVLQAFQAWEIIEQEWRNPTPFFTENIKTALSHVSAIELKETEGE